MQFRFWASLIVFIGSYFPLGLILLAQDYRYDQLFAPVCWPPFSNGCALPLRNGIFPLAIFCVTLVCFVLSLGSLATVKPKTRIDVLESKYIPAELMSYTLPYVVSFMSLDYQETGKFVGLLIFLAWMFLITYRSGQLILNPVLIVFGWRLYEISFSFPGDKEKRTARALSRVPLEPSQPYDQSTVQDIMIIKSDHHKGGK
ncbi:hypothetical protein LB535_06325 [Mesorhizobium sp. CA10]|uniref:hypothetical protein n=1 Tax=Mesorhizobium sp. CA10 TaxID=588495 RepID=UPI001CCFD81D|nr:hypothetical protein [Mesorhizobium sp. CA10]MBZ9881964.1 hypothetical protein [Mesorhizobium sp. CA10]